MLTSLSLLEFTYSLCFLYIICNGVFTKSEAKCNIFFALLTLDYCGSFFALFVHI